LIDELGKKPQLSFAELIQSYPTRLGVIFNFLAILELLALQVLTIQIGEGYSNFWISKGEATEAIL
jgi:segregation and condensation protein A